MTNRDIQGSRFVLGMWHILPQNRNELNVIIRYLEAHPKLDIELNYFTPENTDMDLSKNISGNLTALDASDYLIAGGIESSRVSCDHYAESKLPMFRFVD